MGNMGMGARSPLPGWPGIQRGWQRMASRGTKMGKTHVGHPSSNTLGQWYGPMLPVFPQDPLILKFK